MPSACEICLYSITIAGRGCCAHKRRSAAVTVERPRCFAIDTPATADGASWRVEDRAEPPDICMPPLSPPSVTLVSDFGNGASELSLRSSKMICAAKGARVEQHVNKLSKKEQCRCKARLFKRNSSKK
eukprot:6199410-Pleurochrysis_carterae.AAC.2